MYLFLMNLQEVVKKKKHKFYNIIHIMQIVWKYSSSCCKMIKNNVMAVCWFFLASICQAISNWSHDKALNEILYQRKYLKKKKICRD